MDQKYSMFNARCETLSTSRAFRTPFKRQRGILPMSSFIEWRNEMDGKIPWRISTQDDALAVAALWDVWDGDGSELLSCTLVTTDAAPQFLPWHRRMPVLLSREEIPRWLDNAVAVAAGPFRRDGPVPEGAGRGVPARTWLGRSERVAQVHAPGEHVIDIGVIRAQGVRG